MIIRAKLENEKNVYRDIYVDPYVSLYVIASYVVASFGFNFDHSFGFYQSSDIFGKGKDLPNYELFFDIGEEVDDTTESVAKTLVSEIFTKHKQWWMLFDYGDDWVFELECIDTADNGRRKSGTIIKRMGTSPKQYG